MHTSFRLGRVAGVETGANWSWPIVVALAGPVVAACGFRTASSEKPASGAG